MINILANVALHCLSYLYWWLFPENNEEERALLFEVFLYIDHFDNENLAYSVGLATNYVSVTSLMSEFITLC